MKVIGEVVDAVKKSALFDEKWYLAAHQDVALVGLDPAEHYVRIGARLHRDPGPKFSTKAYLDTYPDVISTGINPLYHYLKWGQKEGRISTASSYVDAELSAAPSVPQPAVVKSKPKVAPKRPPTVGEDLSKKLWGGFSVQALGAIDAYLKSDASAAEKTLCLWNVARFYAAERNWDKAQDYLKQIRKFDKKFINQKRPRLLEAEIAANQGNFEKADKLISYPINNGSADGDFHCAMSNLVGLQVEAGADVGDNPVEKRLEWMNHIYSKHGLSHIELIDRAKGLVFGNITSHAAKVADALRGPKISVLMPVYNAEDFIETSVKSMLGQTWENVELVAVDDCSTDRSWEILQELAKSDSRLSCYKNEQNMGAYPTRNYALSMATGDFITVHDSDDWSHPQMLEVQIKAMLDNPEIKASFSSMTRVFPNMLFSLRPERNNMEYIHRSYPSLMIRRSDLNALTRWDPVVANADDEFVQRARGLWGKDALRDILPDVPFSYFLKHEASLTSQKSTNLRSLTYGVRHEYSKQADFWRTTVLEPALAEGRTVEINRTGRKHPFPIPNTLVPKHWKASPKYDIIIISDLTLLGGTRRCNEGYVAAALNLGLRVGLFHWPRYDLRLIDDIGAEYRELSYNENVDILTCEEEVSCDLLIIHHPPILQFVPDVLPKIDAQHIGILVNQLPKQLLSEEVKYYTEAHVQDICKDLFSKEATWIPISPLVRKHLGLLGYQRIGEADWFPPYGRVLSQDVKVRVPQQNRLPVIGRHSRDHWTKWPGSANELLSAYCGNSSYLIRFMGGVGAAEKLVDKWPANWESLDFDSISVPEFLDSLDFFLHFTNSDYIEEFGRNIMEAMAHGLPVILPSQFREVFGDAAIYAKPEEVSSMIKSIWADPTKYTEMSQRGFDYVRKWTSQDKVAQRLTDAIQGRF